MKNGNQQNPALRNYSETTAVTAKRMRLGGYEKPSKESKSMGESRRNVEELIEQRKFERELLL